MTKQNHLKVWCMWWQTCDLFYCPCYFFPKTIHYCCCFFKVPRYGLFSLFDNPLTSSLLCFHCGILCGIPSVAFLVKRSTHWGKNISLFTFQFSFNVFTSPFITREIYANNNQWKLYFLKNLYFSKMHLHRLSFDFIDVEDSRLYWDCGTCSRKAFVD